MPVADVLVPIGTAIIGGASGYATAWRQGKTERGKIEAENNRLREERDDARFEKRADAYRILLDSSSHLIDLWRPGNPENANATVRETYLRSMRRYTSTIVLIGTDEVRRAAEALDAEHRGGSRPDELRRLHAALVEAMRRDVAPGPSSASHGTGGRVVPPSETRRRSAPH